MHQSADEWNRRQVVRLLAGGAAGALLAPVSGGCTRAAPIREIAPAAPISLLDGSLDTFQDWRFGLLIHWGIYSVWGAVESWPIELAEGYGRESLLQWEQCGKDIVRFRRAYRDLRRKFNPRGFDPQRWARAAENAGMKYVVFTTKHHDGFCMFDTGTTDFRVTHPDCPFSTHALADITRHVFTAFREQGLGIGAYFSKPDWNHPDFWDPASPAPDKYPNYDPKAYPDRWQQFVEFTHAQIDEIIRGYGPIDILWLDGSWVAAPDYDVNIDRIASVARRHHPHLIVVDRWVPGPFENYQTPEQAIPDAPLDGPWEICMTMGDQWSYKPQEEYKSTRALIHTLVDVVSKGGNLLLNVGPSPLGDFDPVAYQRLEHLGDWMKVNSSAIYGTRPLAPYEENNVCFTRRGSDLYAIYLAGSDEVVPPERIELTALRPAAGQTVRCLGYEGAIPWQARGSGMTLLPPKELTVRLPCEHAWVFQMSAAV